MTSLRRALGWTAVVVLTGVSLFPAPAPGAEGVGAGESTATITDAVESWWSTPQSSGVLPATPPVSVPPDPCTLPVGCLPVPVPVPSELPGGTPGGTPVEPSLGPTYPAGTLHVESAAGGVTARTYLVPDFALLPPGSVITRATLILPVNEDAQSRNRMLDSAEMVACLTTEEPADGVAGDLVGAPTYDCDEVQVAATYSADDRQFTVDLQPFVTAWMAGAMPYGVALTADPEGDPTQSWHVALNGADVIKGASITTTVSFEAADATGTEPPSTSPTPVVVPDVGSFVPPIFGVGGGGGSPSSSPPLAGERPATPTPSASPAQPLDAAPVAFLNNPWYTYRGVVFLPLAFLVAMLLTGRSLTRPLAAAVVRRSGWRRIGGPTAP